MSEGNFKHKAIVQHKIDLHFDDVPEECELIIKSSGKAALLWDSVCAASIKDENFGKGIF